MSYEPPTTTQTTLFGELLTVERRDVFNLKPTWGTSRLRDETTTSGGSEVVTEAGGEIKISTGAAANQYVFLRTLERGQYLAGTTAEIGIGVRIPTNPTGSQVVTWGYFDANNGFGFKQKADGLYVFRRVAGVDTEVAQADFNEDPLDGSGASGLTLSHADGQIWQIDFTWYGFGQIHFITYPPAGKGRKRVILHTMTVREAVSIIDPNLPVSIRVENGASSTTNLDVYLGGRQFAIRGDGFHPHERGGTEILYSHTVSAAEGVWEPLIAIRKKPTYGPSGRANSVRVVTVAFEMQTDNAVEARITFDAATTSGSYGASTSLVDTETAVQVKTAPFTVSDDGVPVARTFTDATRNATATIAEAERVVLGDTTEVVLWVRRLTSNPTTVSASISWEEQR